MSLLSPVIEAVVRYLGPWIMAQLLGLLLGFVLLETPYGTSSIRTQLRRSLRIATVIFASASIGFWSFTEEAGTRLPALIAIAALIVLQGSLLLIVAPQHHPRHPTR